MQYRRTPLIFWPFIALGRLIAAILGLVFMIVGGVLCLTIIGAIVGIPLALFGFTLMIRGFF
jgi:hypothetical protein